jgi:hypothetical protein
LLPNIPAGCCRSRGLIVWGQLIATSVYARRSAAVTFDQLGDLDRGVQMGKYLALVDRDVIAQKHDWRAAAVSGNIHTGPRTCSATIGVTLFSVRRRTRRRPECEPAPKPHST